MLSILQKQTRKALMNRSVLSNNLIRSFTSTTQLRNNTPVNHTRLSESFLSGSSGPYVEEMYNNWRRDPNSVHASWNAYFNNVENGLEPGLAHTAPPSLSSSVGKNDVFQAQPASGVRGDDNTLNAARVGMMIRAYQIRGHLASDINPLSRQDATSLKEEDLPEELRYQTYGFTEADLDREVYLENTLSDKAILEGLMNRNAKIPLREVIKELKQSYCGTLSVEFTHIQDREKSNWIRKKFEDEKWSMSKEKKIRTFDRLAQSHDFERFLEKKYAGEKRFGVDGAESLIPALMGLIDESGDLGVESCVIGMPHRGRLNVLANVVNKPISHILKDFDKKAKLKEDFALSGDVKYHLGTSCDFQTPNGKQMHLSLVANPSHLEAVNPVVLGKVRAKQFYGGDEEERAKNMGILLHGDAAFAGQGVVMEGFAMSQLRNYSTGGTIHIVVNNQIGFTTNPEDSRSSRYCTDIAKIVDAPIFHVNADDPEACVRACELAAQYRQRYKRDVVVDLIGYRLHGHNEIDNPMFTQPEMYTQIKKHVPTIEQYKAQLINEGSMTTEEHEKIRGRIADVLNTAFDKSKTTEKEVDWFGTRWEGFTSVRQLSRIKNTGVKMDKLKEIGEKITAIPKGFTPHKIVQRVYKQRQQAIKTGEGMDWALAEQLAFATLIDEGNTVKLGGQDCERGTFSHRHAVLHDQKTFDTYVPLDQIEGGSKDAKFLIGNSNLSEYACAGFELGFSLENPNSLVAWEAQFGDFANGAQIIIDQFLACGEQKWQRQSGLVLLLPHGYDGQGPEHSSARLERFLQLTESDPFVVPDMTDANRKQIQESNWQVVNCTTPANYFHVLRRQVHRQFRKPLVVMSPKRMLRMKEVTSRLDQIDDIGDDTRFERVIPEAFPEKLVADESIRKVIFCSGQVYYDIVAEREKRNIADVAVCRVEQLAPFPFDLVAANAMKYPNAEIAWAQEEHMNSGAWNFVLPHMMTAVRESRGVITPTYVGRNVAAAPAAGSMKLHMEEFAKLMDDAMA